MSESVDKAHLLEVWRRDMDPGYTTPLEEENDGRGLDVISGLAAVFERASTAVLRSTQAMYLRPHSQQLAAPASGLVHSTGQVQIYRNIVVGGPVTIIGADIDLDADTIPEPSDLIVAQFLGVNGEEENAPVFEIIGQPVIPSGTIGPTVVDVRCTRPGFQGDVPAGTEGAFVSRRGGTFAVVSYAAGLITIDPALGDSFVRTMTGMFWRFTDGVNIGQYARRILYVSASTALLMDSAAITAQGAGGGAVVDIQEVGDFRIVFLGTTGGRSGELDMLARERTEIGRSIDETDAEFLSRVITLPETVSPNALIRAITAVLDPANVPFQFIEVFEQGVGFFYDDGSNTVDCAYNDPFAYRRKTFYVGAIGTAQTPIGFLVVINGLALPPEPDLTKLLSALTTTIVGSKGAGVPWAVAIEPPVP